MTATAPTLSPSILEQVALGYAPMIDRSCGVLATRLSLFPLRPDAGLDVVELLRAVSDVWPAGGGKASLNIQCPELLTRLVDAQPSNNLMIEIPSTVAVDPANSARLRALHVNGNRLLLQGRPQAELPREVLSCFTWSIIPIDDDRRTVNSTAPEGVIRGIAHVQSGVRTMTDLTLSFGRGAAAVLGWPMNGERQAIGPSARSDLQVIIELIRRVDKEEPIDKLEEIIRRDPTLAFRLLKYINSPAFGLRTEITSFGQAIMMLGYKRLKRWLALLLATASKDAQMRPVMFAAVRRGMLLEELAKCGDFSQLASADEVQGEMFVCGVFSLLDKMMGEPFVTLLANLPVPHRVLQALVKRDGPYWPYLQLIQSVEDEDPTRIREAAVALGIGLASVNKALLFALASASQID